MGLVRSRNFLKKQRLFHLTFKVMVTSLTSHTNGWWGTPYRNSSFWKKIFAHHFRVKGGCFWEWKIQKFWSHIGFPPLRDLQSSSIFIQRCAAEDQQGESCSSTTGCHLGTLYRSSYFWKKFSPGTCPIWGDVFGSKKSKKSDPQSRFPSKLDFQKSSFCSNNPYIFLYTLLSADNRTTRHLCKRYY